MRKKVVLTLVILLNSIGVISLITKNRSTYLFTDKFTPATYAAMGPIKMTESMRTELVQWPPLYLDHDFRTTYHAMKKTAKILEDNKAKKKPK